MNNDENNRRPLAWLTGASGLIGSHVVQSAEYYAPKWEIRGLSRKDFDLTDFPETQRQFEQDNPGLVIHCAAMSDPTSCESEPDKARFINRESTFFLSGLAQDIPFVFFSTDLVFNGNHGQYTEQDEPSPLTVYARTKAEAEQLVLANPLHTVVRTSLTAGTSPSGSRGIDEQLIYQWQKGNSPTLFTDEFRCPIHADATARAIWELVQAKQTGIYHLAGGERMSRYEIGQAIARTQSGSECSITPGSLQDYQGPPRAADTSLNCDKIQKVLSFQIPSLVQSLAQRELQVA